MRESPTSVMVTVGVSASYHPARNSERRNQENNPNGKRPDHAFWVSSVKTRDPFTTVHRQ